MQSAYEVLAENRTSRITKQDNKELRKHEQVVRIYFDYFHIVTLNDDEPTVTNIERAAARRLMLAMGMPLKDVAAKTAE